MNMRKNAPLPKKIGKKIQIRRQGLNFTQEELAEKVNLSRAYIGFIEQGRSTPSLEVIERIAKVLRVNLSELF